MLLALSLAFYASWNWRFLLLLLASGAISYLVGLYVDAARERPFREAVLALGVALDLGILAYFKYLDFFIAQVLTLAHSLGFNPPIAFVNVTLAGRDLVSDLSRDLLHRRRLSRAPRAFALAGRHFSLHQLLPASRRRPDRARARILAAARLAAPRRRFFVRREHAV